MKKILFISLMVSIAGHYILACFVNGELLSADLMFSEWGKLERLDYVVSLAYVFLSVFLLSYLFSRIETKHERK